MTKLVLAATAAFVAALSFAPSAFAGANTVSLDPAACKLNGTFVRTEPAGLAKFGIGTMCDKQFGLTNVKRADKGTPTRGPNMCILRVDGTKDSMSFSCIIPVEKEVVVNGNAAYFVVRETTPFATKGQLLRYNPAADKAL